MSNTQWKVRKGSCLCKSIQYQVVGEPFTVRICHCQNCKKATGGAFLTLGYFNDKDITVTDGEKLINIFADQGTSSGIPLHRYFCCKCGSNLFLRSEIKNEGGKKIGIIAVGTLDDEENWTPRSELFPEQRKGFLKVLEIQGKKSKL